MWRLTSNSNVQSKIEAITFEKLFGRFDTDEPVGAAALGLLPATVEYRDDAEDEFVRLVLSDINVDALEFKLTPTYVVYMAVRHKLMTDSHHKHRAIAALAAKVANTTYHTIQVRWPYTNRVALILLLASNYYIIYFVFRFLSFITIHWVTERWFYV